MLANGHLVPLAKALKTAGAGRGEVVRARLCAGTKGYTYLLTLLARDGKVTFATIDAESGKLAEGR